MSSISCRNSETLNQSFEMRKKAGEYSLEEKLLFLHHFKDVGGTYVASMRELGLSDKEIKEDLNQMLGQMLNASKNIKGQVIDLIPAFVCARSKWFKRLGGYLFDY